MPEGKYELAVLQALKELIAGWKAEKIRKVWHVEWKKWEQKGLEPAALKIHTGGCVEARDAVRPVQAGEYQRMVRQKKGFAKGITGSDVKTNRSGVRQLQKSESSAQQPLVWGPACSIEDNDDEHRHCTKALDGVPVGLLLPTPIMLSCSPTSSAMTRHSGPRRQHQEIQTHLANAPLMKHIFRKRW